MERTIAGERPPLSMVAIRLRSIFTRVSGRRSSEVSEE
jgi:hypothetical protein